MAVNGLVSENTLTTVEGVTSMVSYFVAARSLHVTPHCLMILPLGKFLDWHVVAPITVAIEKAGAHLFSKKILLPASWS